VLGCGERARLREHQAEVGDGRAVRARPGRVAGGSRPVPGDGVLVTGLRRVMDDPRHVGSVVLDQGGEDALVQRHEPRRWHRAGDGPPGQLVPEGDLLGGHGEQAAFLGGGQGGHGGGTGDERADQPAFQSGRHDGQLVEHVLGRRVQPPDPGQHGIGDGGRHLLTLRRGQQLVHEERIPRGERVQVSRIDRAARAELAHGVRRQPAQRQPPHVVAARRVAEQAIQRVRTAQLVVAVGEHEDGGQLGDPPDEVAQRVERRVVGPVHVLDDQHGRVLGPGQLAAQRGQHPVPVAAVLHGPAELGAHAAHQIAERSQRPRGGEIIAVADEHPALRGQMRAQRLDQARLADACLAHDQHDRPVPARGRLHRVGEHGHFRVALQNPPLHVSSVKAW